ncbi:MAG: GGDEF domain-containing protein [Colwellia sp.]|nr:GGDEF domain-containing protein [Colwellia sp.]
MIIIEGDCLKSDLQLCKTALMEIGVYIYVKNIDRQYIYANQLTENLFQDSFNTIIGHTDDELFDLVTVPNVKRIDDKVLNFGIEYKTEELTFIKSTGEQRLFLSVKTPIFNTDKKVIGLIGVSTDITEIHSLQKELEKQANTDSLTGLLNRRAFFKFADKYLSESSRHDRHLSLIMIDIDLFKSVNDIHGHPVGDIIIQFISSQASKYLRKEDLFARVGGEEFAILLPNTDIKSAQLVAEKIRKHVDSEVVLGEWIGKIEPKISLGVSTYTKSDIEFYEMYSRSDKALYKAKLAGRNRVCTFVN